MTAVYSGDTNFTKSTSSAITIIANFPGFTLIPPTATPALIVAKGQTALTTFTVTPTFGYAGTVTFSCSNLPATIGCMFNPSTITGDGMNTARLIALSVTTKEAGLTARNVPPANHRDLSPIAFAGMMFLAGLAAMRKRRVVSRSGWLMAALMSVGLMLGLAGCGTVRTSAGTPSGTYTVNVVLTGTAPVGDDSGYCAAVCGECDSAVVR